MPRRPAAGKRAIANGRLRVGNEWNAISIIARSQTHPLKAVCELTENALDARATVVVIVRHRARGHFFLEVIDDGGGVARGADGLPDFNRIATHVCDSMKRHLDERERQGIHGEFGIGLLSFWSLGEELRMISAGQDDRLYEMRLARGKRTYAVEAVRGRLAAGGTRVIVGPLLPATRGVVTGEKLQRYLAEELRNRIRNSGAKVLIQDRVARRELTVEPREYQGERLALPPRLATEMGDLTVELYFRPEGTVEARQGVAVCKDGTRVLRDLAELDQFAHPPGSTGTSKACLISRRSTWRRERAAALFPTRDSRRSRAPCGLLKPTWCA
jgi:hypothetical protein